MDRSKETEYKIDTTLLGLIKAGTFAGFNSKVHFVSAEDMEDDPVDANQGAPAAAVEEEGGEEEKEEGESDGEERDDQEGAEAEEEGAEEDGDIDEEEGAEGEGGEEGGGEEDGDDQEARGDGEGGGWTDEVGALIWIRPLGRSTWLVHYGSLVCV